MTAALPQSFAETEIRGKSAPLPAAVDSQAAVWAELEKALTEAKKKSDDARKALAKCEDFLVNLVKTHGGPHATKSLILHGIVWEMVATFGQYTTQDAAAVERFRLALVKAKKTRLLKKIFSADTRYTMKASAAEIVKTEKLTPTLMSLLLLCSVTQDKKPALDVRQKKKAA
jgi:hypothetical protein